MCASAGSSGSPAWPACYVAKTKPPRFQRFLQTRRRLRDREDMARTSTCTRPADLLRHPSRAKAAPFLRKAGPADRDQGPRDADPPGPNGHNRARRQPRHPAWPVEQTLCADACRTFIPERYDAPLSSCFGRGTKNPAPLMDPRPVGRKFAGNFQVVEVPGHHHSCISQNSNVVLVGEAMRKAIDQAESLLRESLCHDFTHIRRVEARPRRIPTCTPGMRSTSGCASLTDNDPVSLGALLSPSEWMRAERFHFPRRTTAASSLRPRPAAHHSGPPQPRGRSPRG